MCCMLVIFYSYSKLMCASSENWKMSEKRTGYNIH